MADSLATVYEIFDVCKSALGNQLSTEATCPAGTEPRFDATGGVAVTFAEVTIPGREPSVS